MHGHPNRDEWPGPSVLAVCAHPDDESFGLGAVLADAAASGASVALLCFTHGEASTLSEQALPLGAVRDVELRTAATVLGLAETRLLDYPDGGLCEVALDELVGHVETAAGRNGARALLAFDPGGVTGHPDHQRATEAALQAADRMGLPVIGWGVPHDVATTLNAELGTRFVGRRRDEASIVLEVDRSLQLRAISCHASQSTDNPVLWRRLELQGRREYLTWLSRPGCAVTTFDMSRKV
ncbi:MAG TPA: PIG-L deacetylase family protein [Acidimicrobiales bacterium]|nr:PIG-L deacetylase family protein [Acidimicrobiales bacterium]